jgi:hypothetical protein
MLVKMKSKMPMGTSCRNVDEGVVDDAKVIGESPCQNPSKGVVDNTRIGGNSEYDSSDEVVYDIDLSPMIPERGF